MTKTQTTKPNNRGGVRPGAGRPKGSKTRPLELKEREAVIAAHIDKLRDGGGQTGKTALEKLLKLAEGCVALNRPTSMREIKAGAEKNPDGSWDRFGAWFDRWAYVSKELTKYQCPTFKAVSVMAPPPSQEGAGPIIEGTVTRMPDAEDAERVYLRLIGAAA